MAAVLSPEELEALRIELEGLRKENLDLRHPPMDREDSDAHIRISGSDSFEFDVEPRFVRQLPRAIAKLVWHAIPPALRLKAGLMLLTVGAALVTALGYAAFHLCRDFWHWAQRHG